MDLFTGTLSAFGLSASAGLNAYIPLLAVALLSRYTDWIQLSSPWDTLASWPIISLLLVLSLIEFFADKAPAINHLNDAVQTLVRPVAGAIVFAASAGVITDLHPALALGAGLLIAGSVHATKTLAVRPAVTATTGGLGNTPVSLAEDVISTTLSLLAVLAPLLLGLALAVLISWVILRKLRSEAPPT